MTEQEDKCPLCGAQMLSLACPGGCFTATAHEVDGLACKDRQRAREAAKAAVPAEPADENQNDPSRHAWARYCHVVLWDEPSRNILRMRGW